MKYATDVGSKQKFGSLYIENWSCSQKTFLSKMCYEPPKYDILASKVYPKQKVSKIRK